MKFILRCKDGYYGGPELKDDDPAYRSPKIVRSAQDAVIFHAFVASTGLGSEPPIPYYCMAGGGWEPVPIRVVVG